jgi:CheY-like chemotaxis protein
MSDVDILLVEDNHGDVRLIQRAFETRHLPGTVHAVQTGDEALAWLYRRGEHADARRPDLVVLDLNLPATSGFDVLQEVKSDPDLRALPVVVLTSSLSESDLVAAYDQHANACLVKPVDPDEFTDLVEGCARFWACAASLPPVFTDSDR